jgi:hypothetical protein
MRGSKELFFFLVGGFGLGGFKLNSGPDGGLPTGSLRGGKNGGSAVGVMFGKFPGRAGHR